jgi:hypothetical protein
MNAAETAIRLAGKLLNLTLAGKLAWADAGSIGPWGELPGQAFQASVEGDTVAQIAEIPLPNSLITSYYFGLSEPAFEQVMTAGSKVGEVFGVFAEGYPAEPTDEKLKLRDSLKELYVAARDSARRTWQKVEKFEQLLERLA